MLRKCILCDVKKEVKKVKNKYICQECYSDFFMDDIPTLQQKDSILIISNNTQKYEGKSGKACVTKDNQVFFWNKGWKASDNSTQDILLLFLIVLEHFEGKSNEE